MTTLQRARLEPLAEDECLRLLSLHGVGRIAVVVEGQPLIFPVNYALAGRHIVFRTDAGTKLFGAEGKRVAFEIDGHDVEYHDGWSVLVVGIAREEHNAAHRRALEKLPLRPWVSGAKAHWMRIAGGGITGRRLTHLDNSEPEGDR